MTWKVTWQRWEDKSPLAICASFAIFLLVFGALFHQVEYEDGGCPERDFYVQRIEALARGQLPKDPYRPLGYPFAGAALALLVGDAFTAGRIVSSLSAGGFAWMSFLAAKRLFGSKAALVGLLLLVTNYFIIESGLLVASDMAFASLAMSALYAMLCHIQKPSSKKTLVLIAILLALSISVRYVGVFLLPVFILGLLASNAPLKHKIIHLAAVVAVCTVGLIPIFTANTAVFGSPLYNENWKNTAIRVFPEMLPPGLLLEDWNVSTLPFHDFTSLVRYQPTRYLVNSATELAGYLNSGLQAQIGYGIIGAVLSGMAILGFCVLVSRRGLRDSALILVVGFLFVYIVMIALTFVFIPRYMLIVSAVMFPSAGLLLTHETLGLRLNLGTRDVRLHTALAVILITGGLSYTGYRLNKFVSLHSTDEIALAQQLERVGGAELKIAGGSFSLGSHIRSPYYMLASSYLDDVDGLKSWLMMREVRFLVLGAGSLGGKEAPFFRNGTPSFLRQVSQKGKAILYAVNEK